MVDLADFAGLAEAQEAGIDVDIIHPKTGEKLGITIKVAGPDSERQKKARAAVLTERLRGRKIKQLTVQEMEAEAIRVTAASIMSWDGVIENGKAIECNPQNAERLLAKYPFINDQISDAAGDRAGFIKS